LLLAEDEDAKVKYRVGEVFLETSKERVEKLLEQEEEKLRGELDKINEDISGIKKTLAELKVKLYGKFKNSINLEED